MRKPGVPKIEYGYDRHFRSWCIIVMDDGGNEIESSYVGNKESRDREIAYFKEKHSISKTIKIKAY